MKSDQIVKTKPEPGTNGMVVRPKYGFARIIFAGATPRNEQWANPMEQWNWSIIYSVMNSAQNIYE